MKKPAPVITPESPDGHRYTNSLQAAIDSCHASGGGVVNLAPGTYLTGMLELKSNVTLHLEKGAVLQGCRNEDAYPVLREKPFGEKPGVIRTLLYAKDACNIALTGDGSIDGGFPEPLALPEAKQTHFRPELVFFHNCLNVRIEDLTLQNSGFWCVHLMHCEKVGLQRLTIRNPLGRINTDGIDPDGCRDVTINDCDIEVGDDCIVLKSTEGQPCENIRVRNCTLRTNHGALKIGTEAMGPIRNVEVENCLIPDVGARKPSGIGIALYMKDGSTYENMSFCNIRMDNMPHLAVMIDNRPRYYKDDQPGRIQNITFENLEISGSGRMLFEGRPESPISQLTLKDVECRLDEQGLIHNKPLGSARTEHDPFLPDFLPNPYQFILAFVSDARLQKIRVSKVGGDKPLDRGMFFLHKVNNARFRNLHCTGTLGGFELIKDSGQTNGR